MCRACYGRVHQRKVTTPRVAAVSEAGRRSSSPQEQMARASLEPWQDLTAPIKSIIKVMGCRSRSSLPSRPPSRVRHPVPLVAPCSNSSDLPMRLLNTGAHRVLVPCRRDCDPASFTDPADVREKPVEEELVEYLVYGKYCRDDRPDSSFLSKRWHALDDLVEHAGVQNTEEQVAEWEEANISRRKETMQSITAEGAGGGPRHGMREGEGEGGEGEHEDEAEEGGAEGVAARAAIAARQKRQRVQELQRASEQ